MPDSCTYVDQQTLKLQDFPEDVPTGEMPRNIILSMDRNLVDKVSPGTRVSVLGIASLYSNSRGPTQGAIRSLYVKVVGVEVENEGAGRANTLFTPEEEQKFINMAANPRMYDLLVSSIAPSIHGDYTEDIKKALACQLLGGSRKVLPDGMRLRGDINVLLLGDPSTAKSQFLKFIEKVAPVG
jgi:DNA replication licensing factor MCM5